MSIDHIAAKEIALAILKTHGDKAKKVANEAINRGQRESDHAWLHARIVARYLREEIARRNLVANAIAKNPADRSDKERAAIADDMKSET